MLPKHVARHMKRATVAVALAGFTARKWLETALVAYVSLCRVCPDLAFVGSWKRILIANYVCCCCSCCCCCCGRWRFLWLFMAADMRGGTCVELPRIRQLALIICHGLMYDLIEVAAVAFPKMCHAQNR